jgi:glycosyltransferase involved in cell wall biosynthesis
MSKLVSVVIATYNSRRFIGEAVESVLSQTYQPIEIIVVDDGSTDGTNEELQPFKERIRYLVQANQGPAAARNHGIRAAQGEYVAFLDADDLWAPSKIEKQVAAMEKSAQVGVVHCGMLRTNVQSGVTELCLSDTDRRGDLRQKLLLRNRLATSTVLARCTCFEKAGLFDESLPQAEDWDLWIKISRHFEFDYVAEPLVTYRVHGNNISKKIATMHRNQLRVIQRAFQEDPIERGNHRMRRLSLARIHFDAGDEYLHAGDYGDAIRHLLHSVALCPLNTNYYVYLLRAIMRRPVGVHQAPAEAVAFSS